MSGAYPRPLPAFFGTRGGGLLADETALEPGNAFASRRAVRGADRARARTHETCLPLMYATARTGQAHRDAIAERNGFGPCVRLPSPAHGTANGR